MKYFTAKNLQQLKKRIQKINGSQSPRQWRRRCYMSRDYSRIQETV